MNIEELKRCLTNAGREELGIPYINEELSQSIFTIAGWALEGRPEEGRQVWFCVGNAGEIRDSLPPYIRGRILPVVPEKMIAWMKRGPCDALLLPRHGFSYSDPNLLLREFWHTRGVYEESKEFSAEGWKLWFWRSSLKPLRLFGMDHHHAVLWDMKQILRPLNIKLDFIWLHDGRPPINEAIPSSVPGFESSLDIYKSDIDLPLSDELKRTIVEKEYDGIITSHSIITSYRLRELNLPLFHVNSTRFGNEWIQDKRKHDHLVESIQELLQKDRLRVIHNNRGDIHYFLQYFPIVEPYQHVYIPSLCESITRIRTSTISPQKFLIWDTRQVLLQNDKSPFMKELYFKLKEKLGNAIDSQALLLAEAQAYLPEGYLDKYTAVIHIPYNVSTMSIFQQTRSNIPIWIPSRKLLEELWLNKDEPNELSWTVFAEGTERNASRLDNVFDREVVRKWIECADFYYNDTMNCIITFDSIDDLLNKISITDYQKVIDESEDSNEMKREDIFACWQQVFQKLR